MHISLYIGVEGFCWFIRDWDMEMELSFVLLSSTLVGTNKDDKSEIIGMVRSSGDFATVRRTR